MVDGPRIIVALDLPDRISVEKMLAQLSPNLCRVKIGKTLFTQYGPAIVSLCRDAGFDVFLDLKFHDIPNQVAGAVRAACALDVWMLTVHASGGEAMLAAARDAAESAGVNRTPLLVGVTLLTSLGVQDLFDMNVSGTPEEYVLQLARMAKRAQLDGLVCSALEVAAVRDDLGKGMCIVTPGIRLPNADPDDQTRIMTPQSALDAGSDYLVIGRPITTADNPRKVLESLD